MNRISVRTVVLTSGLILSVSLSQIGRAQDSPPAWNGTTTYHLGDVVDVGGNYYRALDTVMGAGSWIHHWEAHYISNNMTINVYTDPQKQLQTLGAAWSYIKNARIAAEAQITIVLNGTAANPYLETSNRP